EPLPAMIVDLNCLDENISRISEIVAGFGKKIRIASKSIRVPWLLKYILEKGGSHFQGLMCFSVAEAEFLFFEGFDDLLVAYPTVDQIDLELFHSLTQKGAKITLMVDEPEQIEKINGVWEQKGGELRGKVCIDVDMSWKPLGMHLGVYRSSINSLSSFKSAFQYLEESPNLEFVGIMGYEAQIAGMGDQSPFSSLLNPAKKFIKRNSIKDVFAKRKAIHDFLKAENVQPEIFNGGGSGSISTTGLEPWLTELTAGSGFLQSHLFDYYAANKNVPAFCFGLQVSRIPQPRIVTCKSGGFVASGDAGADKWPVPFLPTGIKMISNEGFGEVQTPVKIPLELDVKLGDPLFFRPAKAGEIAERFSEYILIRDYQIVEKVKTYRGLGHCFY
ncbi:MAG TPA: alanine racemase, partial [Draconibacterium sp.]|nr:alanine racemase [Draconibacterium sp.]